MNNGNPRDQLDLLLHIEKLTEELNKRMNGHSRTAIKRYPLTFGILALFGIVAVSEGAKGLIEKVDVFRNDPFYLLLLGLLLLTALGSVYRKLDK
jgi:hypothetical protein